MSNRKLTWRHLKALHQLYIDKRTEAKITDNAYIKNVLIGQKKLIKYKSGNVKILEANTGFTAFYEQHFGTDYLRYETFLREQNLETDARRRYTEDDIQTLMFIAGQKEELVQNLSTIRTFSSEIFKGQGSKYLENKQGLKDAVCKILGIADFPEKDPKNLQWRFVVDCLNPRAVVLCENIAHLKNPWKAREQNIELWYVGGNNIGIIDYISPEKLSKPLYYSCDWDYHGLSIYSRIKEKLRLKSFDIGLLLPDTYETALPVNSPYHKSEWNFNEELSGLNRTHFSKEALQLINKLINENKWIEEESLDLITVMTIQYIPKNV
ncbi:MAG: hypothetical protein ABS46_18555 [Cytophagaceae bacterium SCN 52-12]|nr:MAG: hypothetical protein ABS46_18555 [Cytophagaceae bacterium SCN 52-12]